MRNVRLSNNVPSAFDVALSMARAHTHDSRTEWKANELNRGPTYHDRHPTASRRKGQETKNKTRIHSGREAGSSVASRTREHNLTQDFLSYLPPLRFCWSTPSGVRVCLYVFACCLHLSPRTRKKSKGRKSPRRTRPNLTHAKCTNTKHVNLLYIENRRGHAPTHTHTHTQRWRHTEGHEHMQRHRRGHTDKQQAEPPLATSMVCSGLRVSCAASRLRPSAYECPRFGRARCA